MVGAHGVASRDGGQPGSYPWDGRQTGVRLAVRLLGITFGGYLLVTQGAVGGPLWIAVLSALGLAAMYVLVFLRNRPLDGWPISMIVVMMLCGAAVAPFVNFLPMYLVVIGGIILIGQPQLPLRISVPLITGPGLILVISTYLASHSWLKVFSSLLGYAVVALIGATRRQSRQRDLQSRELVSRSLELEKSSLELEKRSRELIAQTERTRQEMARAAALEERGRIARDIHDVLAHSLGGLVVQLDAAEALLTERADLDAAAHRLRDIRQLAVDGLREAKNVVNELQEPAGERPVDLGAELAMLLNGPVAAQLGLELDILGEPYPVPSPVASAFTSVAREAVTNLNKHAPGGPGKMTVIFEPTTVVTELVNALTDPHHGPLTGSGAGLGLPGMQARMAEVGGSLTAGRQGDRWVVHAEWTRR